MVEALLPCLRPCLPDRLPAVRFGTVQRRAAGAQTQQHSKTVPSARRGRGGGGSYAAADSPARAARTGCAERGAGPDSSHAPRLRWPCACACADPPPSLRLSPTARRYLRSISHQQSATEHSPVPHLASASGTAGAAHWCCSGGHYARSTAGHHFLTRSYRRRSSDGYEKSPGS
eukprot:SAG31_NODE_6733_length_1907_cov_1.288717_1_plen_174_part_00